MLKAVYEWINSHPVYSAEDIINKIKPYKYVSFDIFDTLIKRSVAKPKDVLLLVARRLIVELKMNVMPEILVEARISAEEQARKLVGNGKEVTLDGIYNCLASEYQNIAKIMESIELDVEMQVCHENPIMKQVYVWCRKNEKKILIFSDMYLSRDFIIQLLGQCGYEGYLGLFISSELNETKYTGALYKKASEELTISCKEIIHIGDSMWSDYLRAKCNHLAAIHIARDCNRTFFLKTTKLPAKYRTEWKEMEHIISGYIQTKWNIYYQYGFEVIGPLLYEFCLWLRNKVQELNVERLFFLARDGYLIQKTYEHLFRDQICSCNYLYLSRKTVIKAQTWIRSELNEVMDLFAPSVYLSCKDFCDYFDLEIETIVPYWNACGLDNTDYFLPKDFLIDRRLLKFYDLIKQIIIKKSKEAYEKLFRYFEQNKFYGNVGIVDIGWKGTIQDCLQIILDAAPSYDIHLSGCYLGLSQEARDLKDKYSFIPIEENPQEFVAAFLEYPFLAPEGSLNGFYISDKGIVTPELAPYEFNENEDMIVKQMQEGALFYVDCFKNLNIDMFFKDSRFSYSVIKRMSKNPTYWETKIFGDLTLYDSGRVRYLAAPQNLFYYMIHLSKLKFDLSNAGWRTGFLKRLLRLPLDYNKPLHWYKERNLKIK